jgi:hypothetical protein
MTVVICKWTAPGVLYGKTANECSEQEIINEVWAQLKMHVNDDGAPMIHDGTIVDWVIDPGMLRYRGRLISEDPLVLPSAGQLADRPDPTTAIPNLLLAGDYLKSEWEVANMETACFNGRRAANAILGQSGSSEAPAKTIGTYRPPEWEPFKQIDALRYADGQPNLLDVELTGLPGTLDSLLGRLLS